ncbi:MAG: membrane protein insertase YidC [bacterium]
MDQRRLALTIAISVLVMLLYQQLINRFFPHLEQPAPVTETPSAAPLAGEPPAKAPNDATAQVEPDAADAAPAAQTTEGRDVVVDTDLYRATFTTLGARLKSLELKRYSATVKADSPPLQLVLFPVATRLPLELGLRGQQERIDDSGIDYSVDQTAVEISADDSATLAFTGAMPGGATVQKRITVHGNDYLWTVDVDAGAVPPAYTEMALGWDEGIDPAGANAAEVVFDNILVLQQGKLQHLPFADLEAGKLLENDIAWAGFSGRYFLAALMPQAETTNALRVWARKQQQTVEAELLFPPGVFTAHTELYVGPKDIDRLEKVGHGLRKAVDLGWFSFIALPMLQALRFLHKFTGNYGVAIIILTVLLKLLFYPLTKKSFQSMSEMQKLQPEMQRLRERLKDKPDEMNREIMELYRRHKVNPLGGCLPMVLQIPVFVGLYNALLNAVELRHAPFIGWIHDLSAPDRLGTFQLPYVHHPGIPVLTLVMGGSMLLQQWMTPSAADPAQQRAMMIMPIVFTFMFMNFPAGLTLYWLVNNCLTIAQQYTMLRNKR